jgi:predicted Zn finger-like uncharacterized protein
MRIACPKCHATYEVPDALLDGGTKEVRCAKCNTEWLPIPIVPNVPVAAPRAGSFASPTDADTDTGEMPPGLHDGDVVPPEKPLRSGPRLSLLKSRRGKVAGEDRSPLPYDGALSTWQRRGPVLGWVATFVVLLALLWAVMAWHEEIMALWPASERLYAALGLLK